MENQEQFPQLLTADQVASILHVPLSTVQHWAARGEGPPSFKVGRHRRFDAKDVHAWLACRRDGVA